MELLESLVEILCDSPKIEVTGVESVKKCPTSDLKTGITM
jgi:hypothetical protein